VERKENYIKFYEDIMGRKEIEFEVQLPKGVRIKDIRVDSVKLDNSWITTVRENHRNIDKLPLGAARRKYG
jgi:hypothetical protein